MDSPMSLADDYRDQAAELRLMAAQELDGSAIKDQLLDLAARYERLARETARSRYH